MDCSSSYMQQTIQSKGQATRLSINGISGVLSVGSGGIVALCQEFEPLWTRPTRLWNLRSYSLSISICPCAVIMKCYCMRLCSKISHYSCSAQYYRCSWDGFKAMNVSYLKPHRGWPMDPSDLTLVTMFNTRKLEWRRLLGDEKGLAISVLALKNKTVTDTQTVRQNCCNIYRRKIKIGVINRRRFYQVSST